MNNEVKTNAGVPDGQASATSKDVLSAVFAPDDTVRFRIFDDKHRSVFNGAKLSCRMADFDKIEEQLKKHNEADRCVSFVVNSGGDRDEEIARINAQFVEMDDSGFEEQWKRLKSFPLRPSFVVQTKKSLHAYWLIDKPDINRKEKVNRFREIQKRLVKQFKGDPACVNESRAMRLPGFFHCKTDERVLVTCADFHPELRYSQEALAAVLPEAEDTAPIAGTRKPPCGSGAEKGLGIVTHSCLFIKHCADNAVTLPEPLWYAMICNLAGFEGGTAKILELSRPHPKFSEKETLRKIEHFLKSGVRPTTCAEIGAKGFECPKAARGECGVNAPAGLCSRPLDAASLDKILNELPVSGDAVKDMETAVGFVKDYLYNQDFAIAQAVIDESLRTRFGFKEPGLKALKQLCRKNRGAGAAKPDESGDGAVEARPWIEWTRNGPRILCGTLADHLAETEHFFYTDRVYRYKDGVYKAVDIDVMRQTALAHLKGVATNMPEFIKGAAEMWKLQILREGTKLNPDPLIINLKNGLFDPREKSLKEHTPEYLSTVQLPVLYDPEATCPKFEKFLAEVMEDDKEQVNLIQEVLGYCLVPVTSAQKSVIFVGAPGAGKSVLLKVLNKVLLGDENVSNIPLQKLDERFNGAAIYGKLANICSDLPSKKLEDSGFFKAVVGEDVVSGEYKYGKTFSFKPTTRLLFSCNMLPAVVDDKTFGFYRKLLIIRFNRSVPEEKRDPGLLDKFGLEASGIFNFAVEGLKRLLQNNWHFSETEKNRKEINDYRKINDSVLAFCDDECETASANVCGSTELYRSYVAYCADNGLKPCGQGAFVRRLTAQYSSIERDHDKTGKQRILRGIKLNDR